MPRKKISTSKKRKTPVVDENLDTMPTTTQKKPRLARSLTRKRVKKSAVIERSVSPPPQRSRKRNRPLIDREIYENLIAKSDDNCSNFDDDVGDPDFFLESNHNSGSEQSENEAVDQPVNEVHQEEINLEQEQEENTSETEARRDYSINVQSEETDRNEQYRQDQGEEEEAVIPEEPTSSNPRNFYGKKRYKWSSKEPSRATRVRSHNIVIAPQQVSPTEFTSFRDIWRLFFTEEMIEKIVGYTNGKLIIYRAKYQDTGKSELGQTNERELKALIGLLFYTSVFNSNHENAEFNFATDGTGREIFRCVMSKNRFLVLLNCLRFDNAETRTDRLKNDELAAISEIFDAFISNCKQNYTLGIIYTTHVCIDEMLEAFRGRCKFRIYMPNKPNKYGLKVLLLVDADTFYVYNAYIYHGRGSDGRGLSDAEKRLGIPSQSIIRLSKDLEGSNRNITADNWFTSIELLNALKDRGLTYLGTMKKYKKEIPPEFQPHKDREEGTSLYGFTKDFTMVSYVTKPKKSVILVSSMHHTKETDVLTNKPIMITDYNKTKGGVDEVDKKCSNYSCYRRTRRWPMVLFYRLIDLSGVNSYVLYNKCTNKVNMRRGPFLLSLARELVLPEMKLRVYNDRIPRELRLTIERVIGPTDMPEAPPPKSHENPDPGTRKTFAICPSHLKRRTKYYCYQCKKPMCLTCCRQICNDCILRR